MSLTNKLADKISTELNYDSEKSAVISYGIFAVLQILASLALVAVFGLLLGIVVQALIVSFAISILRQYSGGVHATRPSTCLIIGTIATIALAIAGHYLIQLIQIEVLIALCVVFLGLTYYLVIKNAPVDSPEKPIKTQNKRKRMKKSSLVVLSVYFCIIIVFVIISLVQEMSIYLEYALCISLATLWQGINLTKKGHRLLRKVDSLINKILFKTKEDV